MQTQATTVEFGAKGSPNYVRIFAHPQTKEISATYHDLKGYMATYYFKSAQHIINFIQSVHLQRTIPQEEVTKLTEYLWEQAKKQGYSERRLYKDMIFRIMPICTTKDNLFKTLMQFETPDKILQVERQPLSAFKCNFKVTDKQGNILYQSYSKGKNGFCRIITTELAKFYVTGFLDLILKELGFYHRAFQQLQDSDVKEIKNGKTVEATLKTTTGGSVRLIRTYGGEFSQGSVKSIHGHTDVKYPEKGGRFNDLVTSHDGKRFFYMDLAPEGYDGYFITSSERELLESLFEIYFGAFL